MSVSIPHAHERAKATPVSRERFPMPAGHRGAWLRRPWAVAGPGRASRRRAERSSQRGRRVGGPPPTGAQSSPARQVRPNGAQNTSGATSNKLNREFRLRCPWAAAGPGGQSQLQASPDWRPPRGLRGLAAVPVGGGRDRAGLEIDHSEPQARVWRSRGRAAAHRHTQRPGPTKHHKTPARHSKRGRHQPTPCASALTHP